MREAALALKAFGETGLIAETKKAFPGAEVQAIRPINNMPAKFFESGGDQVPFAAEGRI